MNEKHIYLALLKIKNNTSINELIHEGLDFNDISNLLRSIIKSGYLTETDTELILSQSGNERLNELEISYKKTNKNEWIRYDEKNLIKKLKKNDTFVPSSKELTFKLKKIIRQ
ncbi:hypothetical protein CMU10_06880 [Elizabethkingia anophelis]|uniref:hypothetical protein n=1 Tax=Elizabethkingia anophelis TaxID=1117645 RepID=UPI0021A869AB|nr:hypothetical protein [Elizabethkingia anophelis]MCT4057277.1 hypothetical protein [Elizabethkingia anophelis]MCT4067836.1 hypothetical protein [Elizabethkingia anophelis]MCT4119109.1 hypothetical protein [Elizabethkingia anophelis]MCT4219025.1 hypothetical protein [Elizabethkingia anophelis]